MTLSEVVTACMNLNIPVTDKEHRQAVLKGVHRWCDGTSLFEKEGVVGFSPAEMKEIAKELQEYQDLTTIFLDLSCDTDGDSIPYQVKRFVNMILYECVNAQPSKYLQGEPA